MVKKFSAWCQDQNLPVQPETPETQDIIAALKEKFPILNKVDEKMQQATEEEE